MEQIRLFINDVLRYGFDHYKDFVFGLLIGMSVAWIYHKFIGNRSLKASYERILLSKEETIGALSKVIEMKIENADEWPVRNDLLNRILNFFRWIGGGRL